MLGRTVGSYRIVEKIGEGGMGAVYRAMDEMLDREVAIKAIRPELAREPQIVERFRAEAKILARVTHPAIATIYSFFYDAGELFLAMEYVRGRTLAEVIAAGGALPWQQAVPLLATALEGIERAHQAGIVHRDLKPENLMLTEAGTLKVMDFGIARMTGSSHMTRTGLLVGTLRYIAPEQIRGEEVDRRTDIYALGTVLYQLVTGKVPFDGPTDFAILKAQLEDPPVPPGAVLPGIPEWLDRAVLRALEKEPAARFQSVAELQAFLSRQGSPRAEPQPETAADFPTRVLPPRPAEATPSLTPASPATMQTDRPRLPAGPPSPPVSVAPPSVSGTSYRPVEAAAWKRGALAAAVVLSVLAAGVFLWTRRGGTEAAPIEPTPAALPASAGAPDPLQTAAAVPVAAEPAPVVTAKDNAPTATTPPRSTPAPRTRTAPQPENPPPSRVAAPTPLAVPQDEPAQVRERPSPAPAEPAPQQEAPTTVPEPSPAPGDLPYEDLRQTTAELVTRGEKLAELYESFLGQKEDGGAELTESDEQLQSEIENLNELAERLTKRLRDGIFSRGRLRTPQNRFEVLKRARALADAIGRVDRLMAQVQPGPEVRHQWQEVRQLWRQVGQMTGMR